MKFSTIPECLHSMIDGYSNNEALIDATNAYRTGGKEHLESFLDSHLWVPECYTFDNDADKVYYIGLSQIEEALVHSRLIYTE